MDLILTYLVEKVLDGLLLNVFKDRIKKIKFKKALKIHLEWFFDQLQIRDIVYRDILIAFFNNKVVITFLENYFFEVNIVSNFHEIYDYLFENLGMESTLPFSKNQFDDVFNSFLIKIDELIPEFLSSEGKLIYRLIEGKKSISDYTYKKMLLRIHSLEKTDTLMKLTSRMDKDVYNIDIDKIITEMEICKLGATEALVLSYREMTNRYEYTKHLVNWYKFISNFSSGVNIDSSFLIGPAGIGKSTLLRILLIKRALNLSNILWNENNPLEFPIFIPFKILESEFDLMNLVINYLKKTGELRSEFIAFWKKKSIFEFLSVYRISIYFDALDEIPTEYIFKEFLTWFPEFINQINKKGLGSKISFIITSRPEHIEMTTKVFSELKWIKYYLMGFNFEQAKKYTKKWFEQNYDNIEASVVSECLFAEIRKKEKEFDEILNNPLLLAMLATYFYPGKDLPKSKSQLLEYLPDFLAIIWDKIRGVESPYSQKELEFGKFKKFFEFIAFENMVTEDLTYQEISKKFIQDQVNNKQATRANAITLVKTMESAIGKRPSIGTIFQNRFLFNLKLFQEYFSAARATSIYSDEHLGIRKLRLLISPICRGDNQAISIFINNFKDSPKKYKKIIELYFQELSKFKTKTQGFTQILQELFFQFRRKKGIYYWESHFCDSVSLHLLHEAPSRPLSKSQDKALAEFSIFRGFIQDTPRHKSNDSFKSFYSDESFWINIFKNVERVNLDIPNIFSIMEMDISNIEKTEARFPGLSPKYLKFMNEINFKYKVKQFPVTRSSFFIWRSFDVSFRSTKVKNRIVTKFLNSSIDKDIENIESFILAISYIKDLTPRKPFLKILLKYKQNLSTYIDQKNNIRRAKNPRVILNYYYFIYLLVLLRSIPTKDSQIIDLTEKIENSLDSILDSFPELKDSKYRISHLIDQISIKR